MPVHLTCLHCSLPFTTKASHARRAKYCSKACFDAARLLPIDVQFRSKFHVVGDCWEWHGRSSRLGYGRLNGSGLGGKDQWAHRFALESALGFVLPKGFFALHTCDNPPCVRNDEPGIYVVRGIARPRFGHLWMGTTADNSADMVTKERQQHGDRHWERRMPERVLRGEARTDAKLTEAIVKELRRRYAEGTISQTALAREFGIPRRYLCSIVNRHKWAHI